MSARARPRRAPTGSRSSPANTARGIASAIFHPAAVNEAFNLSTPTPTTVLELARTIWGKVHGTGPSAKPFRFESDPPYPHDVARRIPETSKAKRVLGFEAKTTL